MSEKHQVHVDQISFILHLMENPGPWRQIGHCDGDTFKYRSDNLYEAVNRDSAPSVRVGEVF